MIVAIPKEINAIEPRVAATPSTVKDLIKSGLQVRVETLAGNESFFSDQEYVNAGAKSYHHQVIYYLLLILF